MIFSSLQFEVAISVQFNWPFSLLVLISVMFVFFVSNVICGGEGGHSQLGMASGVTMMPDTVGQRQRGAVGQLLQTWAKVRIRQKTYGTMIKTDKLACYYS